MARAALVHDGLLRNTGKDALDTAARYLGVQLGQLRDAARYVDNYHGDNGQGKPGTFPMRHPLRHSSVEALLMETSDLAQAYGYITALAERD